MPDTYPYNAEVEAAFLGCMLIDPGLYDLVGYLKPDDFYLDRHKVIWRAIVEILSDHRNPDLVTLSDLLAVRGELVQAGGLAYLTGLMTGTISTLSTEQYAGQIADLARRRRVILASQRLVRAAHDTASPIGEAIAIEADNLLYDGTGAETLDPVSGVLGELYDEIGERMKNPNAVYGIPTGFLDIDHFLGGLQTGEIFYLAGAPGVGKTRLAFQIGMNIARGGVPVGFFSLEMKTISLVRRLVSGVSGVTTHAMRSGKVSDEQITTIAETIGVIAEYPIFLRYVPGLTLEKLRTVLARAKRDHGVRVFVLDYLLLMSGFESLEETERSARLSRGIKNLCMELDLAGLVINSVTKTLMGDTATPQMRDLRGSGQVIHDADVIAFLMPPEAETSNILSLVFTKTRDVDRHVSKVELLQKQGSPFFYDITSAKNEKYEHQWQEWANR